MRWLLVLVLAACGLPPDVETEEAEPAAENESELSRLRLPLSLGRERLVSIIGAPAPAPHDAIPVGVPGGYDWREASTLHTGNRVPAGFTAVTGWGQVFSASDSEPTNDALLLRNNQTFVCTRLEAGSRWFRVQNAGVEGATFSPDFAGNVNTPAVIREKSDGVTHVTFRRSPPSAFHWWPNRGRAVLPAGELCGVLFLFEAKAQRANGQPLPTPTSDLLIGGGADYWLSTTAPWNNYLTNAGLGVGQLLRVTSEWQWFGYTTAKADELQSLRNGGFYE